MAALFIITKTIGCVDMEQGVPGQCQWQCDGCVGTSCVKMITNTGKELDDSTGLYFYEARYYDAVLRGWPVSKYD